MSLAELLPDPGLARLSAAAAPDRWRRMVDPVGTIAGLGLVTLGLHLRDPHASGSWGLCPSAMLGFWCPGCGGLRAVNDLTDLRFADALSSNLLLLVAMPFVLLLLARWASDRWRGIRRPAPSRHRMLVVAYTLLPLIAVFTVLRNTPLPIGTWLAP